MNDGLHYGNGMVAGAGGWQELCRFFRGGRMSTKHTPEPWRVLEDRSALKRFDVARKVGERMEWMRDKRGRVLRFHTEAEARAAIAKAEGGAA